MICPGTNRPPPIASELERVRAEVDAGRGTRGVEYLGAAGDPPPEPSRGPAGSRGAAEGVRPGTPGAGADTGEASVTPLLISAAGGASIVAASWKPPSSVAPMPMGSSPKTVAPLSTSGAVEEPHDEQ